VRTGDELFMWRAEEGLFAYCIVTGDAEPVTADSYVPWPNREKYNYVWPIEIVTELPTALPVSGKELDELAGIGRVPFSQLPPIAEERTDAVRTLFGAGENRLVAIGAADALRQDLREVDSEYDARVLAQRAIRIRQGQGRFRAELLAAYGGHCCITDCDVEPVLEAAHIVPYKGKHTNRVWNGLLLRADVHTLFDLDRLTILPNRTVRLDPMLAGTTYGDFDGRSVRPARTTAQEPAEDVLLQHNARCQWL
jgi:putative restriction endonuclease